MKRLLLALAAVAAVFLAGCATQAPAVAAPQVDPRDAVMTAVATCATAIERIATGANGDPASRVAAVGAIERMCGSGGAGNISALLQAQQRPQETSIASTAWSAFLSVVDVGLRAYGIKVGSNVAIRQVEANRDTSLGAYQAFTAMGGQIRDAGTAGYPYVQAPQANQTWTLSGTGVLGSGSYTGPVTTTTTRNCNGGNAGAAVPPAVPGAGGAANC